MELWDLTYLNSPEQPNRADPMLLLRAGDYPSASYQTPTEVRAVVALHACLIVERCPCVWVGEGNQEASDSGGQLGSHPLPTVALGDCCVIPSHPTHV